MNFPGPLPWLAAAVLSVIGLTTAAADGELDTSFDAKLSPNGPDAIAVDPDGRVIAAGFFDTVGETALGNAFGRRVIRLNADGSHDTSFAYGLARAA